MSKIELGHIYAWDGKVYAIMGEAKINLLNMDCPAWIVLRLDEPYHQHKVSKMLFSNAKKYYDVF